MVAAAFDSRAVAEVLLRHGADPLARDSVDGNTPLDFAAMAGHADFARLLLAARRSGRWPRDPKRRNAAPLRGILRPPEGDRVPSSRRGADINVADYSGVRPLQYARRRLQGLAVELLLSLGARPDNLHDAVNAGDVAHVQALIAGGADVNAYDLSGTPLHLAVSTGQNLDRGDADRRRCGSRG